MAKRAATEPTEYTAMAVEAEASVAAVKDPELRRVAFEKILVTLIERERSKTPSQKPSPKLRDKGPSDKPGRKRSAPAARKGPKGRVETLISDGFFKHQRTIAEVKAELANQGYHIALTSLSGPLQKLTQERLLRRQKVTAGSGGSKVAFAYSNW